MIHRSTYQKLAEENKRLIKDIEILVMDFGDDRFSIVKIIEAKRKWKARFNKDREFMNLLRSIIKSDLEAMNE